MDALWRTTYKIFPDPELFPAPLIFYYTWASPLILWFSSYKNVPAMIILSHLIII